MHGVYRVDSFAIVGPYQIDITFSDGFKRRIDFEPILEGELYGPLRDAHVFRQVRIDREVHTLVWPNGADFDPETLHEWPVYEHALIEMAQKWRNRLAA